MPIRHAMQFILMRNSATDKNWHVTQLSRRRVRIIKTESLWWNFQCEQIGGKSLPVASNKMKTRNGDGAMLCVNIVGVLQYCATTGIMSRLPSLWFRSVDVSLLTFRIFFYSIVLFIRNIWPLPLSEYSAKCRQTSGRGVLLGVISFQMCTLTMFSYYLRFDYLTM